MSFNELSELFLMQCAMGSVSPPSSDARMAAALMPIWSAMKLSTVLMDRMRCIVNNVSTSNSGLDNLVSAQGWMQCKLQLLTQCFLVPSVLISWPCITSFHSIIFAGSAISHISADCKSWSSFWGVSCLLNTLRLSSLHLSVRLQRLSSPPFPIFFSLNDLSCSPRVGRWEMKPWFLPVCPLTSSCYANANERAAQVCNPSFLPPSLSLLTEFP